MSHFENARSAAITGLLHRARGAKETNNRAQACESAPSTPGVADGVSPATEFIVYSMEIRISTNPSADLSVWTTSTVVAAPTDASFERMSHFVSRQISPQHA